MYFLNEFLFIVSVALLGGVVSRVLKIHPAIGYVVCGIVAGIIAKSVFPIADFPTIVGIVILPVLFILGFSFSIDKKVRVDGRVLFIAVSQIVITIVIFVPLLAILNFSLPSALILALAFSASSILLALKKLEEKGRSTSLPGTTVGIFLLTQSVVMLPILFGVFTFTRTASPLDDVVANLLVPLVNIVAATIGLLFLKRFMLEKFLTAIHRYSSQEIVFLSLVLFAIVSIWVLNWIGSPIIFTVFLLGFLFSDSNSKALLGAILTPLRSLALGLLIATVAITFGYMAIPSSVFVTIVIVVVITFVKFLYVFLTLRSIRFLSGVNLFISSQVATIGEFTIVVAQVGLAYQAISQQEYVLALGIFLISVLLTPIIFASIKALYSRPMSPAMRRAMGDSHYFTSSEFESLEGHVVICGHGKIGKEVRGLLDLAKVPYVVIDVSKKAVDELLSSSKNALYGDPTDSDILIMAGIERAKIMVVAVPDSFSQKALIKNALKANPKLVILSRSHTDEDKYELVNLGVNTIVMPEFEASLRIGKKVLELLGFEERNAHSLLARIRKLHVV